LCDLATVGFDGALEFHGVETRMDQRGDAHELARVHRRDHWGNAVAALAQPLQSRMAGILRRIEELGPLPACLDQRGPAALQAQVRSEVDRAAGSRPQ